eukprot:scaffold1206_cov388-Prasinococcus_capsulatus_cf.AAC.56
MVMILHRHWRGWMMFNVIVRPRSSLSCGGCGRRRGGRGAAVRVHSLMWTRWTGDRVRLGGARPRSRRPSPTLRGQVAGETGSSILPSPRPQDRGIIAPIDPPPPWPRGAPALGDGPGAAAAADASTCAGVVPAAAWSRASRAEGARVGRVAALLGAGV